MQKALFFLFDNSFCENFADVSSSGSHGFFMNIRSLPIAANMQLKTARYAARCKTCRIDFPYGPSCRPSGPFRGAPVLFFMELPAQAAKLSCSGRRPAWPGFRRWLNKHEKCAFVDTIYRLERQLDYLLLYLRCLPILCNMKKILFKMASLCVMALGCLPLHAEGSAVPDMFITFPDSLVGKSVEISIGGTSAFQMDWGDGVRKDYGGADYFSDTLRDNTLKAYGDGIMILLANNCNVTGIVINNEPSLSKILANNNHLTSIDVSMCSLLRGLYLSGNELTKVTLGDINNSSAVVIDLSRYPARWTSVNGRISRKLKFPATNLPGSAFPLTMMSCIR